MSDNAKDEEHQQMENEIPICGDGWLAVFDLIAPRQIGLQIALLSHRFDYYVDEHFRTRRWTLGKMEIKWKRGENGTKEMQITNGNCKSMPIPKVPLPKKVVRFKLITIRYIDQNVVDFLHLFRRTLASSGTYLNINSANNGAYEFVMHNIWPLIKDNIYGMQLDFVKNLHQIRQFLPSFLNDCPSLRTLTSFNDVFPVFPFDDSANASDGQLVANWLFSPQLLLDGAPKVLKCYFGSIEQWSSKIEGIKSAFVNASSSVNFIIVICAWWSAYVPFFELTNEMTGERLTLKRAYYIDYFLLIRCQISRDEQKWAKWEEEAVTWRFGNQPRNRNVIVLDEVSTSETTHSSSSEEKSDRTD